jgi:hypothetical protein
MRILIFIIALFTSICVSSQTSETICKGQTTSFTIQCSGGVEPYEVKWKKPNGDSIMTATMTDTLPGVYTWECKDASTCTPRSGTHTVNLEPNPTDSLVILATNKCINTSQTISVTGVPAGYTFSWNFGSGAVPATATTASANVTYGTTGTKTITITITKNFTGVGSGCNNTCTWTQTKSIIIGGINGSVNCN